MIKEVLNFPWYITDSGVVISKKTNKPRYVSLIRHKRRWKSLWQQVEGSTTIESRAQ